MAAIGTWSFSPLISSFPSTVLPNIAFWSVTNGTWEYQVEIAYPLNWTSQNEDTTVDTMYVLDGNALGLTATEAFRRRRPVEFNQPDTIVVSIGYPETIPDSPYSLHRGYDYQPPVCANCTPAPAPGVPSNADNFIEFIDDVLRPWVKDTAFPNAHFSRDALYGHSFGGLFVLYALLKRPSLFDTFLSASPALFWNDKYILNELGPLKTGSNYTSNSTKPAFQISYGALEQFPVKRRTETQAEFETRRGFIEPMKMTDNCQNLYSQLVGSPKLRDVSIHEYPFSDHATVAAAAIGDGIDYFLDW
ncbi:siderophore esteras-like protein IroE-like protein [Melanomma pulvis-pyrius CBS 109.77]|uniref:Siderophore esteras-like protein IroE-like protein n=1 Tax=Melanomma pulvis-pyrius CBS 109.77 TaxID=1314802 RepID=A0A6A6XQL0_9PLEO|nr:siderophore esteras-like protein IroE-like protein [Melanomma pulvis-pyrius CBS 109.77]